MSVKEKIVFVSIMILVVVVSFFAVYDIASKRTEKRIEYKMQQLGKSAINSRTKLVEDIEGVETIATYIKGDYKEVSFVTRGNKEIVVTDLNKSRILGAITAQKGKEFIKGFKDGLRTSD